MKTKVFSVWKVNNTIGVKEQQVDVDKIYKNNRLTTKCNSIGIKDKKTTGNERERHRDRGTNCNNMILKSYNTKEWQRQLVN